MVEKSKVVAEHVTDLTNTFEILRKHKLRLNASKCSFGVSSGKFLGYMVTHRGIEVNPDQIKAISSLQPAQNPKEVQRLIGMTAALNIFISWSADRCRLFFLLLHKWKGFEWTEECALAFQQLKEYLSQPPIMSSPEVDEVLFSYLAIATYAISFVLIRVDNGVQWPVYYVSKSLHEAEVHYLPLDKAILAVVHAIRKLPHYFQAHTVVVLTQYPLKGQVLADLVADFAEGPEEIETSPRGMDEKSVGLIFTQHALPWKVYVDGAANQRGSGVRLVLTSPKQVIIEKSLRLGFSATNNEVEYEALLMGMAMVRKLGGKTVEIFSDSKLIVGQVRGELEARDTRMQEYLGQVRRLQVNFEFFEVTHVPRSENAHADFLATLATFSTKNLPRMIMVKDLNTPTPMTGNSPQVNQIRSVLSWMDPIKLFLEKDILPEDKSEAKKIRRKAPRFWLSKDKKLYKRSYSGPYLLCVHPEASEALIEELHEGICGSHTGGRSLSHRAITQGYWWPGMQKEAQEYVRKCDQCQRYSTPAYPQENGQAEAVNKVIVDGLKKMLDDAKGRWVEELPHVLWTYRTTPWRSTGETPFSMTYGTEAVIPLETGFPTLRTSSFTSDGNDELLKKNLDLIDERRENAMVQLAYYQQKLKQGYDANVRLRPLTPGDLVLRKVLGTTKNPNWGKLGPNWEGSYCITSVAGIGAHYVEDLDEKTVLHSCNVSNLKRYYY
nr:uncharacterized protein LOC112031455 [Quercus suber]